MIARDLAPYGITVNAVNPSSTETRMVLTAVETFRQQGGDAAVRAENLMKVAQKPEEVGGLIASLCSEEASAINGQIFFVARSEIGLFQPLTLGERRGNDGAWEVGELVDELTRFKLHPLDTPYGR